LPFSSADYALMQDKAFKKHVYAYAKDEELFFKEYVAWFIAHVPTWC